MNQLYYIILKTYLARGLKSMILSTQSEFNTVNTNARKSKSNHLTSENSKKLLNCKLELVYILYY